MNIFLSLIIPSKWSQAPWILIAPKQINEQNICSRLLNVRWLRETKHENSILWTKLFVRFEKTSNILHLHFDFLFFFILSDVALSVCLSFLLWNLIFPWHFTSKMRMLELHCCRNSNETISKFLIAKFHAISNFVKLHSFQWNETIVRLYFYVSIFSSFLCYI